MQCLEFGWKSVPEDTTHSILSRSLVTIKLKYPLCYESVGKRVPHILRRTCCFLTVLSIRSVTSCYDTEGGLFITAANENVWDTRDKLCCWYVGRVETPACRLPRHELRSVLWRDWCFKRINTCHIFGVCVCVCVFFFFKHRLRNFLSRYFIIICRDIQICCILALWHLINTLFIYITLSLVADKFYYVFWCLRCGLKQSIVLAHRQCELLRW
jgi:hypothetical protein